VLILLDTSAAWVNFPGGLKGELDLVDILLAQFPAMCRRASPPSAKNHIENRSHHQSPRDLRRKLILCALAAGKLDLEAGIALWDAILATVSPGGGLNPSDVVYAITDGALSTPLTRIHRHG